MDRAVSLAPDDIEVRIIRAVLYQPASRQMPPSFAEGMLEKARTDFQRTFDRVEFINAAEVTHFYSKDKVTFAASPGKHYIVDSTIAELEEKLHPGHWIRIHRSTLLNIDAVRELHSWFGGKLLIKLKDGRTELSVERERAADVRAKLGV
jgi:DNA-binding LytR/AlgR family response regulator